MASLPDRSAPIRITHGRHCTCGACASEDWTNPKLAPCGMHGASCPREYQPRGKAGMYEYAPNTDPLVVVAMAVAAQALRGTVEPEWENYPDIGEHDWDAITCWLESHAAELDLEQGDYTRAYDELAGRAER